MINLLPFAEEISEQSSSEAGLNLAPDLCGFFKCVCYINPTDAWRRAGVLCLFQREFISGSSALTRAHSALPGPHTRSFFMCSLIL